MTTPENLMQSPLIMYHLPSLVPRLSPLIKEGESPTLAGRAWERGYHLPRWIKHNLFQITYYGYVANHIKPFLGLPSCIIQYWCIIMMYRNRALPLPSVYTKLVLMRCGNWPSPFVGKLEELMGGRQHNSLPIGFQAIVYTCNIIYTQYYI